MGPREVLNKLKWHPDFELNDAEITILHRGAPGDRRTIQGEDILDLGKGFMTVRRGREEVKIPYHRVLKINTPAETVWQETG
ncbi:hypothetical protein AKJ65_05945 [candidate division MSBL1 archaeon SCGC-AAA259E19]|uniref:UPF0248 protein AKJ65_05945 n=1 Tax=candidate division MSBL1 archaeon SCGC-AAA259E19 TaxID=1698264 RepID=A0A133UHZ1_9EURY|nr:hypothetical protein AKJ65_05945 [candidate division MSBL1 archaeon SCGC-AAA259E19]